MKLKLISRTIFKKNVYEGNCFNIILENVPKGTIVLELPVAFVKTTVWVPTPDEQSALDEFDVAAIGDDETDDVTA